LRGKKLPPHHSVGLGLLHLPGSHEGVKPRLSCLPENLPHASRLERRARVGHHVHTSIEQGEVTRIEDPYRMLRWLIGGRAERPVRNIREDSGHIG
jgi:hypothetical protein